MTLETSAISLIECMLRRGAPMSTVGMPSLADIMGPIVLPHAMSCRITKSYQNKHTSF